jgi:hypothetical protein
MRTRRSWPWIVGDAAAVLIIAVNVFIIYQNLFVHSDGSYLTLRVISEVVWLSGAAIWLAWRYWPSRSHG